MQANDTQIGGEHYKQDSKPQHWDLVVTYDWDYFEGQITKYLMRWRKKGGIQDLEKARHYLDKYIEVQTLKEARDKIEKVRDLLKQAIEGETGTAGPKDESGASASDQTSKQVWTLSTCPKRARRKKAKSRKVK